MRRFYEEVTTRADASGAIVLLDGRVLRTPARAVLLCPSAALAEAVAAEWAGQGETVAPAAMRLTRLATTAVDLMPARRADAVAEAAGFAAHDLLCYRAAGPPGLVARQDAAWQPWLAWALARYDAWLDVARTLDPIAQPERSLAALRAAVAALDDWRLTGLHAITTATGSLVLALAVEQGALDAAGAFDAALLDELAAIERWGIEEGQARRHAALRADLDAAAVFLRALPP
jgi:chaperone required for assembly of F1-ATPase